MFVTPVVDPEDLFASININSDGYVGTPTSFKADVAD
jgi:hypothetical protein